MQVSIPGPDPVSVLGKGLLKKDVMSKKYKKTISHVPASFRVPGSDWRNERNIEPGTLFIDHACFKHSEKEKLLLKIAKSNWKESNKK